MAHTNSIGFRKGFATLCNAPIFRNLTTQKRRRLWVIATLSILASFAAVILLNPANTLLLMALGFISAYFFVGLGAATSGLTDIPLRRLDEQQRHMRLSLFSDPYAVGAVVGLAGGVLAASFFNSDSVIIGAPIVSIVVGLPAFVMAWKLPDNEADNE